MVAEGLNRMVLDACRNNPLARSMQRTAATRTVSGGSFGDLNEDLLGDETLVAYAAAAGTTAADGAGAEQPVHGGAAVAPGNAALEAAGAAQGDGDQRDMSLLKEIRDAAVEANVPLANVLDGSTGGVGRW